MFLSTVQTLPSTYMLRKTWEKGWSRKHKTVMGDIILISIKLCDTSEGLSRTQLLCLGRCSRLWLETEGLLDWLTCERDSLGSREDRVCRFLLWASRSTNITDQEQPCSGGKKKQKTAQLLRNCSCFTGKVAAFQSECAPPQTFALGKSSILYLRKEREKRNK